MSRTHPPATDVPMPAATFAKWLEEALPFAPPRAATASATAGRKVSAEWLHARYAAPADLAAALKRAFIHARVESLQVLGMSWLHIGGYERLQWYSVLWMISTNVDDRITIRQSTALQAHIRCKSRRCAARTWRNSYCSGV